MQSHLHTKHLNAQEVIHALISYFFHSDMTQNGLLQRSYQTRTAQEDKRRLSRLWISTCKPTADVQYFEELNQAPLTNCPAFWSNPNLHSLSYNITD